MAMTKTKMMAMGFAMAAGLTGRAQQVIVQAPTQAGVHLQVGGSVVTVGQVKDDLFAGTEKFAKGASDVTEINLDPKMMGMVPGSAGEAGLARGCGAGRGGHGRADPHGDGRGAARRASDAVCLDATRRGGVRSGGGVYGREDAD